MSSKPLVANCAVAAIVLLSGLIGLPTTAAQEWDFTVVDGGTLGQGSTGTPLSLVLDAFGYPHIAYTASFNLPHDYRYAYYDGTDWHVEVFDEWPYAYGTFFADISLALDTLGHPHIAYTKVFTPDGELLYAHHDGTDWQITTVTDTHHAQYCSIALDSADNPRIAFYSSSPWRDLLYASFNGNTWDIEPVDSTGWVGYYASLAIDSLDHPHIAYRDGAAHTLKYAHHNGATWDITIVNDPAAAVGYGTSLALDSFDRPHVAYTANTFTDSLLYSYYDGSDWHNQSIGDAGRASSTSIAVDSQDRPHIAYDFAVSDAQGPHDHMYTRFDGLQWQTAQVEPGYGMAMDHEVALDDAGRPHIAFGRRPDLYEAWLIYAQPVSSAIPGDLNNDGCVDQADLGILLADWNCTGNDCPGDADHDGDTDQADLGVLLAHWGEGCP